MAGVIASVDFLIGLVFLFILANVISKRPADRLTGKQVEAHHNDSNTFVSLTLQEECFEMPTTECGHAFPCSCSRSSGRISRITGHLK
jgi:hypothetical protein